MDSQQNRVEYLKAAGYTHKITYQRYVQSLGMWVDCDFPTTGDAVRFHTNSLQSSQNIRFVNSRTL